MKKFTASKTLKSGAFTTLISVAVIALVVIINVVVSGINFTKDVTATNLYSLTSESKEFAKGITDSIRIYYFAQTGSENPYIYKLAQKYDGLGTDMKFIQVDPVLHPNYAAGLVNDGSLSTVESDTVIVVNETNGRTKTILASEMIVNEYQYTSTYPYYTAVEYSDVEGQIDSAILYVTTSKLPEIYCTSGHGEQTFSSTLSGYITKNNISISEIETLTVEEIPDECDILYINFPAYDFTEGEIDMIKAYLANGGKAFINVSQANGTHSNLQSLLNYYGLDFVPNYIIETDSRYYYTGNPYYLLPAISAHDITSGIKGVRRVCIPASSGLLEREDIRDTVSVTALLTTTDGAYSKVDTTSSAYSYVDGVDILGPFMVGACVSETVDDITSQLIVYSSEYAWEDTMLTLSTYGNADLLMNSINYLTNVDTTFNVPAVATDTTSYLDINEAQSRTNVILKMIVLPLSCLIAGIAIFVARRRAQ